MPPICVGQGPGVNQKNWAQSYIRPCLQMIVIIGVCILKNVVSFSDWRLVCAVPVV